MIDSPSLSPKCTSYKKREKLLRAISTLTLHVSLESIYFNSIIPCVVYNIVVLGSVFPPLMEDIERIHMRAIRVVCKLPKLTYDHFS